MRRGGGHRDQEAGQTDHEHQSLYGVGPGDGAHATDRFVHEYHERQEHDTDPVGHRVAGKAGRDVSHRHQLCQQVVGDGGNEE